MVNKCNKCGVELVIGDNWTKGRRRNYRYICKQCHNNYNRSNKRKHYKNNIHTSNKDCNTYIGTVVYERMIERLYGFKRMKPNNEGYDLVMSNGLTIDVKCSSGRLTNDDNIKWFFDIRKNKIPNYFFVIAFDNRDTIETMGAWFIPSEKINDVSTLIITLDDFETLSDFDVYDELMRLIKINKVMLT